MGLSISVKPSVEVLARVDVLHYVVGELVNGFGGRANAEQLRKGILEAQIIRVISLNYLDTCGERVARIRIEIDWEKHRVLASVADGDTIAIDTNPCLSVSEQISGILPLAVYHSQRLRKEHDVKRVVLSYKYVPEVQNDSEEYARVRRRLGTVKKEFEWSCLGDEDGDETEFVEVLNVSPGALKELTIRIEQVRSKKWGPGRVGT